MKSLIDTLKFGVKHAAVIFLLSIPSTGFSVEQSDVIADATCQNANLLSGKLFTDICWECLYPIKISGIQFGSGYVPNDASDQALCSCADPLGLPKPGNVVSMFEPARLVEVVRGSGCSPTLGGIRLPLSDVRFQGTAGNSTKLEGENSAFYHYHYFSFPLLIMLEMFIDPACNSDGYVDLDLMFLSEIDPTWNNSQLAFFTHPEASAFSNPIALSACSNDAVASTSGHPMDELFWCGGTWGGLYPFSGHINANGGFAQNTNHLAAKALASLHRRGFARKTMGNDNLCSASIAPMIPKSQYKMSMVFPVPEGNTSHFIGEHQAVWGSGKVIPGAGEDAVIMLYRWNDCCTVW